MQHRHQVLPTAGHLALHGQAEVLLHALGDAPSDRVVPEGSDRETDDTTVSAGITAPCVWGRNKAYLKSK